MAKVVAISLREDLESAVLRALAKMVKDAAKAVTPGGSRISPVVIMLDVLSLVRD